MGFLRPDSTSASGVESGKNNKNEFVSTAHAVEDHWNLNTYFNNIITKSTMAAETICNALFLYFLHLHVPNWMAHTLCCISYILVFLANPVIGLLQQIKSNMTPFRTQSKVKNLKQSLMKHNNLHKLNKLNYDITSVISERSSHQLDKFGYKCRHNVHITESKIGRGKGNFIYEVKTPSQKVIQIKKSARSDRPHVVVDFSENLSYPALLDTGSCCNILTNPTLDKIRDNLGINMPIQKIDLKLQSHSGNDIPVLGAVCIDISIGNETLPNVVFVVTNEPNEQVLLGAPLLTNHGISPVFKDGSFWLYISSKDSFVECRKFYDKSRKILMEITDNLVIPPKQHLFAHMNCSESNGQRTNIDGTDGIFTFNDKDMGYYPQLLNVRRGGKVMACIKNRSESTPMSIAAGTPIGCLEIVNMKDYDKVDATTVMEIVDTFDDITREKVSKCFCQLRGKNLIFREHKGENVEFANTIHVANGPKKTGTTQLSDLTIPYVKYNTITSVNTNSHTPQKLDEKFSGKTAALLVPSIRKLKGFGEMNNIAKFVKANPEVNIILTELTPCSNHSFLKKDSTEKVNICLVVGEKGLMVKPIEGDTVLESSVLKDVYVVVRNTKEKRKNVYVHIPSDKLNSLKTLIHIIKNVISYFANYKKLIMECRINNIDSDMSHIKIFYDAWTNVMSSCGKLIQTLEWNDKKIAIDRNNLVTDETPIPLLTGIRKLPKCLCMVCLNKRRDNTMWVNIARHDYRPSFNSDDDSVDQVENVSEVTQMLAREYKRLRHLCPETRPTWIPPIQNEPPICKGYCQSTKTAQDVFRTTKSYVNYGIPSPKIKKATSLDTINEFLESEQLMIESNDPVGQVDQVEAQFKEHITKEQRDFFDSMSVISEKDIDDMIEEQEIDPELTTPEETKVKIIHDWREVVNLSHIKNEHIDRISALLDEFKHCLSLNKWQKGKLKLNYYCEIPTVDEEPIFVKSYDTHPSMSVFMEYIIAKMLKDGTIQEDKDAWVSPIFIQIRNSKVRDMLKSEGLSKSDVEKSLDSLRIICDFRVLNSKIVKFPNERVNLRSYAMNFYGFLYASTADISAAYKCIPLHPKHRKKAGFMYNNRKYHFTVMIEGLCHIVSCFQQLVGQILKRSRFRRLDTHPYWQQAQAMKLVGSYKDLHCNRESACGTGPQCLQDLKCNPAFQSHTDTTGLSNPPFVPNDSSIAANPPTLVSSDDNPKVPTGGVYLPPDPKNPMGITQNASQTFSYMDDIFAVTYIEVHKIHLRNICRHYALFFKI